MDQVTSREVTSLGCPDSCGPPYSFCRPTSFSSGPHSRPADYVADYVAPCLPYAVLTGTGGRAEGGAAAMFQAPAGSSGPRASASRRSYKKQARCCQRRHRPPGLLFRSHRTTKGDHGDGSSRARFLEAQPDCVGSFPGHGLLAGREVAGEYTHLPFSLCVVRGHAGLWSFLQLPWRRRGAHPAQA